MVQLSSFLVLLFLIYQSIRNRSVKSYYITDSGSHESEEKGGNYPTLYVKAMTLIWLPSSWD